MRITRKNILITLLVVFIMPLASLSADMLKTNGGRIFVYDNGNGIARIHTYMSPFKAAANTSSIIELRDRLVIVDMQFADVFAKEFRSYADSLGKPIDRIYLSHEHPDHWMGSIAFQDVRVHALQGVIDFVRQNGETILKKKGKPGKVPNFGNAVTAGKEMIGGLTFEFATYKNAESADALVIALPELKTLIAQDLLYSNTHLYLGQDSFDLWIAALETMKKNYGDYEWFIPGHGEPQTTTGLADDNIVYLHEADKAFDIAGSDLKKIQEHLYGRFPDLKARFFVPFSVGIALKNPNQHK